MLHPGRNLGLPRKHWIDMAGCEHCVCATGKFSVRALVRVRVVANCISIDSFRDEIIVNANSRSRLAGKAVRVWIACVQCRHDGALAKPGL